MGLRNACPVFIAENVQNTVNFYVDKLGFQYAEHYDKQEKFATVYRDAIEIIIVEKRFGNIAPNYISYGSGYDAYIDTVSLEEIDSFYLEFQKNNVKIIQAPVITAYGSYEFVFEDNDGRRIGIGLVADKKIFFKNSNISLS